jgi:hypothetical protein
MVGFKEFLGLLLAVSAGHIMYQRLTGGPALTQNRLFSLIQCADHSKCTILYK